jgi:predicted nucleic-acid-binding protein
VEADRDTALAGLAILDAGGDFADGVIAHQGRKLGGEIFLSFNTQAVRLLKTNGADARVPA